MVVVFKAQEVRLAPKARITESRKFDFRTHSRVEVLLEVVLGKEVSGNRVSNGTAVLIESRRHLTGAAEKGDTVDVAVCLQ